MKKAEQLCLDALKEAKKKQPEIQKVINWLNKSKNLGEPKAAYALGTWYLHGNHVRKNLRCAIAQKAQKTKRKRGQINFQISF